MSSTQAPKDALLLVNSNNLEKMSNGISTLKLKDPEMFLAMFMVTCIISFRGICFGAAKLNCLDITRPRLKFLPSTDHEHTFIRKLTELLHEQPVNVLIQLKCNPA